MDAKALFKTVFEIVFVSKVKTYVCICTEQYSHRKKSIKFDRVFLACAFLNEVMNLKRNNLTST